MMDSQTTSSAVGLLRLDLLVNIRFPGLRAHGIQVAAMAEALAATGLIVDVVVPRRYPYRAINPWSHYDVKRTFRIQRIASLDVIDMFPQRFQRLPFLLQSVSFGWRALARVAVERQGGVLVRDHYSLDILAHGLRRRDLKRVGAEIHDLPLRSAPRRRLIDNLKRIPAVITISDGLKADLVADGLEEEKILVARDGVHLSRFEGLPDAEDARRHLGLAADVPTVVYAGQLYPWKGVDDLVKAVGRLPDLQLVVVGGISPDLERVRSLADKHAPGRVWFCGSVPYGAVPFHLAAGDIIALPNSGKEEISARYTSPLKLFEAMASSRPIVASDLPSLKEVLKHGENAHLVEPDDPEALAEGIEELLRNPKRSSGLAERARRDVQSFDWKERGRTVAYYLRDHLEVER